MTLPEQLQASLDGTYTIVRELGAGGMATVYLAHDLRHDRDVALKVLHTDLGSALGPERFQREIRLAARLQHPHILTVLDSGGSGGRLWFTMPFVEGESLRDRLTRETQLSVADALRIASQAAQALQYAHQHGVIHRDIKPENLLLTEDGNTLVADFGIARSLAADDGSRLTGTGLSLGTPAYMSPEQASGELELTARTDIYSLGAVLYEMLAGEPPFTGPTAQVVIAKRFAGEVPDVRRLRPSVPEPVAQAVARALAMIPADRWATAADFARALAPETTAPVAPAAPAPARHLGFHGRRPLFATLVLGFALGLGLLFGWSRYRASDRPSGNRLIAVLPFENMGDSADAYFADGITDAVRGKLTSLSSLRVTASNSSAEYKQTHKTPREIARELGVDYLLVGKVRWAKSADGTSRVQVSPELIQASTEEAKWQQSFDAPLTDVFQMQSDIASRVASALNVALGSNEQRQLAERPTQNLAAYNAYLRGDALDGFLQGDPVTLRQAITFYERATALDPGFSLAWSKLSRSYSLAYANGVPTREEAEMARKGAERAEALAPNSAEGFLALGDYHHGVTGDNARALAAYSEGLRVAPGNVDLLDASVGVEQYLGQWDSALVHAGRSVALDPRSATSVRRLGVSLLYLRHYPEARAAFDRGLALAPANLILLEDRAMTELAAGDLAAARAVVAAAPRDVDPASLVAYFANYQDLFWVLTDAQQQLLLRLTASQFDDDRATWGLVLAQTYRLRGDMGRARAYADTAATEFERQLKAAPNNPQLHVLRGLSLAYAGRDAEGISEGERGSTLLPLAKNAFLGVYLQHQLMRIYLLAGRNEKAIDALEPLVKIPYVLSPGWLRIDPAFVPLRGNPRFERLVQSP